MIPRTFPSVFGTAGETKMVVYVLPSITGLQAWKDYIPVKGVTSESNVLQNTYNNSGYQVMNALDSITGKQAWKDYIPVYEDAAYNKPWSTDAGGYIPGAGLFSVLGSLFANNEQGAWYDPSDIDRYMSSLGPELVTNGDFSNGTTGWGGAGSVSSGRMVVPLYYEATQSITLVAGRTYQVTFDIDASLGQGRITVGGTLIDLLNTTRVGAKYYITTLNTTALKLGCISGTSASYDNISVKELTSISTATLFQDSAGTTPVTAVEQPVGLVLDKRKGLVLGNELVTNGDFSNGTTGWTFQSSVTATIEAGRLKCVCSLGSGSGTISSSVLTAGKTYRVTLDYECPNGQSLIFFTYGGSANITLSGTGAAKTQTLYFTAGSTQFQIYISGPTGFTYYLDNISVRELPGNHAYQSTSASRPVLSARVNLLTKTEQFDDAVWGSSGAGTTVNANKYTAPNGTMTADEVIAGGANASRYQTVTTLATSHKLRFSVRAGTANALRFGLNNGGWLASSATIVSGSGSVSGSGLTVLTGLDNNWTEVELTATTPAGSSVFYIYPGPSTQTAGASIGIWGADLRVANTGVGLPSYQRVNTATDYDTVGFPKYLKFDGVDDFLVTNSIDFTAGDKMTVVAGVRKLSDAARGMLVELGAGFDTQSFNFSTPDVTGGTPYNNYGMRMNSSNGGGASLYVSPFVAPITNVVSAKYSIAGLTNAEWLSVRVNSVGQSILGTGTAMTGNFGNYPLYIGRRGGTSLPFNGHLYGLIVRGAASSAFQISGAEKYMNDVTKAY